MKTNPDQTNPKFRRIIVFGDSHAVHCFDRFTDATIFHQGPTTMHRVGRDGANFVSQSVHQRNRKDLFVFVFGEIDVRCHIGRISDRRGASRSQIAADLVARFAEKIHEAMIGYNGDVVLCSVIPASDFISDPQYPTYGDVKDRIDITKLLNKSLKLKAAEYGFFFLDFASHYANRTGALSVSKSDGAVHIGLNHTLRIRKELSRVLNEPVRYRWEFWWRSWLIWPIELLMSWLYPPGLRLFNRRRVNISKAL